MEPPAIDGPLGPLLHPIDKPSIIPDCLETRSRAHDFWLAGYCWWIHPLLTSGPRDASKEIEPLKLRKARGIDRILQINVSGIFKKYLHCKFIQPLPTTWSIHGTLYGSNNHNSAETATIQHFHQTYVPSISYPLQAACLRH
jgi:hypothetical protein